MLRGSEGGSEARPEEGLVKAGLGEEEGDKVDQGEFFNGNGWCEMD